MAAQFDQSRVVLSPTQKTAPVQTNVFDQAAGIFGQQASTEAQSGQASVGRGLNLLQQGWTTASAAFDKGLDTWNKYAEERAARDAPAIIQRDGNKQLIPPSSFYPPGISTRAYAESYRKNAEAVYRTTAENDYQYYAEEQKQKFPGDVAAFDAAMKPKREAMLANLDPRFAPFLDLRFQQIDGQAANQIAVRIQSDANTRNKELSDRAYNALVSDGQVQAAWASRPLAPGEDPVKHADNVLANAGIYGQRWTDYVTMAKTAGASDVQIAAKRDELAFNVAMYRHQEAIRSTRYDDGQGNVDAGKIADDRESVRAIARNYPGREQQVEGYLFAKIDEASGQSQRYAAGQVYAETMRNLPRQRDIMRRSTEAQLLPDDQWEQKAAIMNDLRREGLRLLNDSSIGDKAAMTLASAYAQGGAISRSALQESNSNRIQGLAAVAGDPAASQPQKAAVYENAVAIRNSPEVMRDLTTGQRAAVQGIMDDYVKTNYGMQVQASTMKFLEGTTSPAKIDEIRAEQIAKNMIPLEQMAAISANDAAAKKLWHEKNTQSSLAAEYLADHDKGRATTPERLAAAKKEIGWKPPGNAPSVDLANPTHVASVQEHYQRYGFLPDLAESAFKSMSHSPDPSATAGHRALFDTIKQVERAKMEKTMGTEHDDDKERMLDAKVKSIVGDNYEFLAISKLYDTKSASDATLAFGGQPSAAGATGMTADQARTENQAAVSRLAGVLEKSTLNSITRAWQDPASLLRGEPDKTPTQKAIEEVTGITSGGGLGGYLESMIPFYRRGDVEKITFNSNFSKALVERAMLHQASNGKSIKTALGEGGSVSDFTTATALFTAIRNGEVSAIRSADGKSMELTWKTLADHISRGTGVQLNEAEGNGFAVGLVAVKELQTGGAAVEHDHTRVRNTTYRADNGELRVRIVEQDRTGNINQLEDISMKDPRISMQSLALVKAATRAVIANAADPEVYGEALFSGVTGGMIGPPGTKVQLKYPFEGYANAGALIGGAIQQMQIAINRPEMMRAILNPQLATPAEKAARNDMQIEFDRQWVNLETELKKIPNAPGLGETIQHMIQNHAPDVDSSAFREMIKNSSVYQPGKLPPVRTNPARPGP